MTRSRFLDRGVSFSLSRKLGLLFVGLLLLLSSVCGVVIHQLVAMRADARRLLEESRELALTNDLDAHFESIGVLLRLVEFEGAPMVREQLLIQIQDVRAILDEMNAGPEHGGDPSRVEHQAEELELTHALEQRLSALEQRIVTRSAPIDEVDHLQIQEMRESGRKLEAEASEEAQHAERDLRSRSGRAARVMLATVVLAALGLGVTLVVAWRSVVRPLRELRRRALAMGRGQFESGAVISSQDEIGALAQAFDEMAGKVAATQVDLEHRVASRTRDLARAARYADLGVLAAGVAHEINNPLASIASCAEGLQRRLERGTLGREEEAEYFKTIASQAYRARDITKRLLTLARRDPIPPARVELQPLLAELERVTGHQLEKRGLRLHVERAEDLAVMGDSGELLQALVNLVLNARDASPAGGVVRVSCAREGDAVLLDVDDQGLGVPPDLVERIFEPFFTTKAAGEGTGLGLSLVAAIVEGHRGSISVGSAPGGGARFRVRIPLAALAVGSRP